MKLTPGERAAHRASFAAMDMRERVDYLFSYYKLELVIASIAVLIAGTIIMRILAHKDTVLYLAYANVAVESGLDEALGEGFAAHLGLDARENEVYRYRDLYLSDDEGVADHRYAYASRMKILGAVDAEQLDVVIMGRDAYDILSSAGYLADLTAIISETDPETQEILMAHLVSNEAIIEDNMIEYNLGEADTYKATVIEVANAIDVTGLALFEDVGLDGHAYLGVIANSPRRDAIVSYLEYLVGTTPPSRLFPYVERMESPWHSRTRSRSSPTPIASARTSASSKRFLTNISTGLWEVSISSRSSPPQPTGASPRCAMTSWTPHSAPGRTCVPSESTASSCSTS